MQICKSLHKGRDNWSLTVYTLSFVSVKRLPSSTKLSPRPMKVHCWYHQDPSNISAWSCKPAHPPIIKCKMLHTISLGGMSDQTSETDMIGRSPVQAHYFLRFLVKTAVECQCLMVTSTVWWVGKWEPKRQQTLSAKQKKKFCVPPLFSCSQRHPQRLLLSFFSSVILFRTSLVPEMLLLQSQNGLFRRVAFRIGATSGHLIPGLPDCFRSSGLGLTSGTGNVRTWNLATKE